MLTNDQDHVPAAAAPVASSAVAAAVQANEPAQAEAAPAAQPADPAGAKQELQRSSAASSVNRPTA